MIVSMQKYSKKADPIGEKKISPVEISIRIRIRFRNSGSGSDTLVCRVRDKLFRRKSVYKIANLGYNSFSRERRGVI